MFILNFYIYWRKSCVCLCKNVFWVGPCLYDIAAHMGFFHPFHFLKKVSMNAHKRNHVSLIKARFRYHSGSSNMLKFITWRCGYVHFLALNKSNKHSDACLSDIFQKEPPKHQRYLPRTWLKTHFPPSKPLCAVILVLTRNTPLHNGNGVVWPQRYSQNLYAVCGYSIRPGAHRFTTRCGSISCFASSEILSHPVQWLNLSSLIRLIKNTENRWLLDLALVSHKDESKHLKKIKRHSMFLLQKRCTKCGSH